jgi:hypothetical protein
MGSSPKNKLSDNRPKRFATLDLSPKDRSMNNNGRPMGARKTVQLLVILTILAWATQTLFRQWGYGAVIVPSRAALMAHATTQEAVRTIEVRPEITSAGGEVTLREVCRWSEEDQAALSPFADVVVRKQGDEGIVSVDQIRVALTDAGVDLKNVHFSGAAQCAVTIGEVPVTVAKRQAAAEPIAQTLATTQPVVAEAATTHDAVSESDAKPQAGVIAGQFMTVSLKIGPDTTIETVAKALDAGVAGDTIEAKNEATGQVYNVKITGPNAGEVRNEESVSSTSN